MKLSIFIFLLTFFSYTWCEESPVIQVCPPYDPGDTAWVLLATILVLGMMPALGFFESGLLRRKNALSIITEVIVGLAVMEFLWFLFGFSLVYGTDYYGLIGGLDYIFYYGLGETCLQFTSKIPGLAFASFESMFAAVTPLLMTGAIAERMKFRSFILFICLWEIIVYYPLAHWIWGGGFLRDFGVYDFAGGIVIHTSAGVSSLILAATVGKRLDLDKYHGEIPPHNVPLATLGTALLWMGWYGFNAGSALTAGMVATYAINATTIASCTGATIWALLSLWKFNHVHTIAVLNGAISGMAGITAISGYIRSVSAFVVSLITAILAWIGVIIIKGKLQIDDALDVSAVHGVTGIIGSISIGFFAETSVNPHGPAGWIFEGNWKQVLYQVIGVAIAIAWSGTWTAILLFIFRFSKFFKIVVEPEIEKLGLDYYYHGNYAYVDLEDDPLPTEIPTTTSDGFSTPNLGRNDSTIFSSDDEQPHFVTSTPSDPFYSGYRI